ncbi:MAG: hypothetical protein AAGA15_10825 [Pseudomonadota bacterium]
MILAATFLIPALIGILTGLRGFRDRPRTAGEFAWGGMWAILFGIVFVFGWHVVWLGAASVAAGTSDGLMVGAVFNTSVSAIIWFPCLMISYTFNAQRGLHDDAK